MNLPAAFRRSQSFLEEKIRKRVLVLRHLGTADLVGLSAGRILSIRHYYLLQRSLLRMEPFPARPAASRIGPAGDGDFDALRRMVPALDPPSRKELLARIFFYETGLRNCHIARTADGEIAAIQWLVSPEENGIIEKTFRHIFLPLGSDQVMVENVFTFPRYRGLGYMRLLTMSLMDAARRQGYRRVVTYIRTDRIAPINEFISYGFRITRRVPEYRVLGCTRRIL